jgi:hypothetical protein
MQFTAPFVGPSLPPLQFSNTTSSGVRRTSTTSSGLIHNLIKFFMHLLLDHNSFIGSQRPVMRSFDSAKCTSPRPLASSSGKKSSASLPLPQKINID